MNQSIDIQGQQYSDINNIINHSYNNHIFMNFYQKYYTILLNYKISNSIINFINNYLSNSTYLNLFKDYLLILFIYNIISHTFIFIYAHGPINSILVIYNRLAKRIMNYLLHSTFLKKKVQSEIDKAMNIVELDLIRDDPTLSNYPILPKIGINDKIILEKLEQMDNILPHSDWQNGKVSGAVYHGGDNLINLQSKVFEKFCVANQLHPDVFPAVRKMESEIVSMVLNMFNAPSTACGTSTSGGTESLLLACLSAKMYGLNKKGIKNPEIIIPETAHAGFAKAAYYFNIKLHSLPVDKKTFKLDCNLAKRFINKNTVLLVGSAVNYPHGIMDDIEGLSKLAIKYDIPLHVDCCLGSFVIAFMEKSGFNDLPLFDFKLNGVTSISCDTHKYGFAPKGSSIIMYRNNELRSNQYFVDPDWTGGLYGSPTLAGSRPGALMAGCWATMINMGENGYIDSCKNLVNTARFAKKFIIENIPELDIIGDPLLSVISFNSNKIDVHELSDKLSKKNWHLSTLQKPAALHIAITHINYKKINILLELLKNVCHEMSLDPNSKPSSDGTSALYGVAGSVKTTGVVDKMIMGFLDALYKLSPQEQKECGELIARKY